MFESTNIYDIISKASTAIDSASNQWRHILLIISDVTCLSAAAEKCVMAASVRGYHMIVEPHCISVYFGEELAIANNVSSCEKNFGLLK